MKPGATTRPSASISRLPRSTPPPTAVMRPAVTATSPRTDGAPVPSTMRAFRMTRSAIERRCTITRLAFLKGLWNPQIESRGAEAAPRRRGPMKISWFHLMPWRWLPDDFRERYHSVWVDLPNRLYDPERGHHLYNEYLDMLEYADQLGFDAIGVNEHHQNAYGMMPSPNIMAAALARRTQKAMLLVLGNSIALYNPPVRVAEEFAMLDVISGGRLIAGFPVGTSMDTNYCYGENPATLRDKYREAHDLILKAWASREPFAWNGKYTKLRYVNLWPRL